jgi:1,4-alpha-glucan branching enzyme
MKSGKKPRRQSFFMHVPGAHRVQLAGDFTDWLEHPIDLQKQSDGLWHVTLTLPTEAQCYRFLVDGQWQEDPECCTRGQDPQEHPIFWNHTKPVCEDKGCKA